MGFDRHRVMEVFARPVNGPGRVGSGYRVNETAVLTAGHVVTGLPVRSPAQVTAGDEGAGRCELRALGERAWVSGSVLWRDESADVALIGLAGDVPPLPPGSPVPRWGRVDGMEPVAVSAVGFPWAQERPDRVRDSEQLFGFIAPATTVKAGLCAVTVQTAAPAGRAGGSPWAGMSGAALFAGPFLVGVVVIDPARFGTDRVVAAPIAPLLDDADLAGLLDVSAEGVAGVGPRLRLAVTAETSLALAPPYRAATPRLGREPTRLLLPEYGIVPFAGRDGDLDTLQAWCLNGTAPALRLDYRGGRVREDQAGRRGVRADGRPGVAGRFRRPEGPGRAGAAGVRPADAAGRRRRRPQRHAARGPGPHGELLAARDPAGPAAAAGPAHHRLVGHPQPAHRPARRRAGRPGARTARRRTHPRRPRRTPHPRADCVRRAPARSGHTGRAGEAGRPGVRQSAAGPHARPAHRLRRAGSHHR